MSVDVLIEPYRAGVMESLNLGPNVLCSLNPGLIYARLTGFGQSGPLSKFAGHDINFLAISGLLSLLTKSETSAPWPPINLLGDFAAGSVLCALGICMALIERNKSGMGQVIDANIVEGAIYLSSWLHLTRRSVENAPIIWPNVNRKGQNLLDGGAPFYNIYLTKDGKYVAVGAIEPKFFYQLMNVLEIPLQDYLSLDQSKELHSKMRQLFLSKTQKEWIDLTSERDVCLTPILEFDEACKYEHNKVRGSFLNNGIPRPSPVLSRTPAEPSLEENLNQNETLQILKEHQFSDQEIQELLSNNVISSTPRSNL